MEVDAKSKTCPVCQYEFTRQSSPVRWIALLLVLLFVLYIIAR